MDGVHVVEGLVRAFGGRSPPEDEALEDEISVQCLTFFCKKVKI